MDRLVHTALSGMRASMERQRVTASNMANSDTIGFRKELADQRPVTIEGRALEARAMQQAMVRGADMSKGALAETGRALDIAVLGDALIAVQAPNGEEAYTARGDLTVAASGLLTNGEGYPVIGDAGPITVPPGGTVSIAEDGEVSVSSGDGAPPQSIGRIKLASPTGFAIAKGLDGLFRIRDGGILPTDLAATLKPGSLEQSNVKMSDILIEMVEQQRLFAMRTKLLTTARELDESGAQLMRLN